jgi:hypothetical protein
MPSLKQCNITKALKQLQAAAKKRVTADELSKLGDPTGALWERTEADSLEQAAQAALTLSAPVRLGVGGEAVVTQYPDEALSSSLYMQSTLDNPSAVAVQASYDRMELALDLDVLTLALDLMGTVQARNSAEKLLCGQLAAAHQTAMQFLAKALTVGQITESGVRGDTVESCRLANTAGRLMHVYQQGLEMLSKVRTMGRQTITVQHQHVSVADGGQPVVAGDLTTGTHAPGELLAKEGTMPCDERLIPSGVPLGVVRKRGKAPRVSKRRSRTENGVECTAGPTPEGREVTSMP